MERIKAALIVAWASIRILFGFVLLAIVGLLVWHAWTAPPLTAQEKAAERAQEIALRARKVALERAHHQQEAKIFTFVVFAACKTYTPCGLIARPQAISKPAYA